MTSEVWEHQQMSKRDVCAEWFSRDRTYFPLNTTHSCAKLTGRSPRGWNDRWNRNWLVETFQAICQSWEFACAELQNWQAIPAWPGWQEILFLIHICNLQKLSWGRRNGVSLWDNFVHVTSSLVITHSTTPDQSCSRIGPLATSPADKVSTAV